MLRFNYIQYEFWKPVHMKIFSTTQNHILFNQSTLRKWTGAADWMQVCWQQNPAHITNKGTLHKWSCNPLPKTEVETHSPVFSQIPRSTRRGQQATEDRWLGHLGLVRPSRSNELPWPQWCRSVLRLHSDMPGAQASIPSALPNKLCSPLLLTCLILLQTLLLFSLWVF